VKPDSNNAGAMEVGWNLSGDIMPVPPYGLHDIPGSDTASKLIVNQPNGNTEATVTGVMNGLDPNTTYTVYLSKTYTPYVFTGWSVVGTWVLRLHYGGSTFDHDVVIDVQENGEFTGTGGYPASAEPPYSYPYNETVSGTINVMTGEITLHSDYQNTYYYDAIGTIASDGTMSGTWHGVNQPTYTWESISGQAVKTHTGNSSWPGLFTSSIQPFTFVTDEYGSGSWHVNLKNADFPGNGAYELSIWINDSGGTILISDVFDVAVE
jgi:hypothetical protein